MDPPAGTPAKKTYLVRRPVVNDAPTQLQPLPPDSQRDQPRKLVIVHKIKAGDTISLATRPARVTYPAEALASQVSVVPESIAVADFMGPPRDADGSVRTMRVLGSTKQFTQMDRTVALPSFVDPVPAQTARTTAQSNVASPVAAATGGTGSSDAENITRAAAVGNFRRVAFPDLTDHIQATRDTRALDAFEKRDAQWNTYRAKMSRTLGVPPSNLTIDGGDRHRAKIEEYDLLDKATPASDKFTHHDWASSLRDNGDGVRYVPLGNPINGLYEAQRTFKVNPWHETARRVPTAGEAALSPALLADGSLASSLAAGPKLMPLWERSEFLRQRQQHLAKQIAKFRSAPDVNALSTMQVTGSTMRPSASTDGDGDGDASLAATKRAEVAPENSMAFPLAPSPDQFEASVPTEEKAKLTGPSIQLLHNRLALSCQAGQVAAGEVTFGNTGSTALFYEWRVHNPDAPMEEGAQQDPSIFACSLSQKRLLPGEHATSVFTFAPPKSSQGVFLRTMRLVTSPALAAEPILLLKGTALTDDPQRLARDSLLQNLSDAECRSAANRIVLDVFANAPASLPSPNAAEERVLFQVANKTMLPPLYYHAATVDALKQLATQVLALHKRLVRDAAAASKLPGFRRTDEPAEGDWQYSVTKLRKLIETVPSRNAGHRPDLLARWTKLVSEARVQPAPSEVPCAIMKALLTDVAGRVHREAVKHRVALGLPEVEPEVKEKNPDDADNFDSNAGWEDEDQSVTAPAELAPPSAEALALDAAKAEASNRLQESVHGLLMSAIAKFQRLDAGTLSADGTCIPDSIAAMCLGPFPGRRSEAQARQREAFVRSLATPPSPPLGAALWGNDAPLPCLNKPERRAVLRARGEEDDEPDEASFGDSEELPSPPALDTRSLSSLAVGATHVMAVSQDNFTYVWVDRNRKAAASASAAGTGVNTARLDGRLSSLDKNAPGLGSKAHTESTASLGTAGGAVSPSGPSPKPGKATAAAAATATTVPVPHSTGTEVKAPVPLPPADPLRALQSLPELQGLHIRQISVAHDVAAIVTGPVPGGSDSSDEFQEGQLYLYYPTDRSLHRVVGNKFESVASVALGQSPNLQFGVAVTTAGKVFSFPYERKSSQLPSTTPAVAKKDSKSADKAAPATSASDKAALEQHAKHQALLSLVLGQDAVVPLQSGAGTSKRSTQGASAQAAPAASASSSSAAAAGPGGATRPAGLKLPDTKGSGGDEEKEFTDPFAACPVVALDGYNVTSVVAGASHVAVLTSTGEVLVWGSGEHGVLGLGEARSVPAAHVLFTSPFAPSAVAAAAENNAPATQKGAKSKASDGLISPTNASKNAQPITPRKGSGKTAPDAVPDLSTSPSSAELLEHDTIIAISSGPNHMAAVSAAGRLYMWGKNSESQLGVGDTRDRDVPTLVPFPLPSSGGVPALQLGSTGSFRRVTHVACGEAHTLALAEGVPPSRSDLLPGNDEDDPDNAADDDEEDAQAAAARTQRAQLRQAQLDAKLAELRAAHKQVFSWGSGARGALGHGRKPPAPPLPAAEAAEAEELRQKELATAVKRDAKLTAAQAQLVKRGLLPGADASAPQASKDYDDAAVPLPVQALWPLSDLLVGVAAGGNTSAVLVARSH